MSFLLDTDVVSAHLRGRSDVCSKLIQHTGQLAISAVTLAELKTWLHRRNTPRRYSEALGAFLGEIAVLPVDETVAERFGMLGAALMDAGVSVATPDLLIAATALLYDRTLVTGNTRHFDSIAGLQIENWLGARPA